MADWYVKYRIEFNDTQNLAWKIDIKEWAAGQGAITDLVSTGVPLKIEYLSDSDDFDEPIRPSKAVFNVWSMTDFALTDLYSDEDFHFKVLIYYSSTLFFQGFIVTSEYSEPYDCVPYPVQITAIDGLNYLKTILYDITDPTDVTPPVYYNGRQLESLIISDILAKIQITGFSEFVNIYENGMNHTSSDSPMDQLEIDVDIFQDMYCDDVLKEILKKYKAVIRQVNGEIIIYRPVELIQSIVYGRIFTGYTKTGSVNFAPEQLISRSGSNPELLQFPGGVLMVKSPAKIGILNQNYGYKQSWLDNFELKATTYLPGTLTFENWIPENNCSAYTPSSFGIDEDAGMLIFAHNTYPNSTYRMLQSFGDNALVSSDTLIFEFEWMFYNSLTLVNGVDFFISISQDPTGYELYEVDKEYCDWDNVNPHFIQIHADAPKGKTEWVKYSRKIPGLLHKGSYSIRIMGLYTTFNSVYPIIKNIRFYATADEISISKQRIYDWFHWSKWKTTRRYIDIIEVVTRKYIFTNAIKGKDLSFDYLLGDVTDANIDNVLEQFAGSLSLFPSLVYSQIWNTYTGTGGGRTSGGENEPILEIIKNELGNQYSRPKQLIQMNIKEINDISSVFNIIGNIQDSLNKFGGVNRKFVFNKGEFDVRNRLWQADLMEIIY